MCNLFIFSFEKDTILALSHGPNGMQFKYKNKLRGLDHRLVGLPELGPLLC